MKHNVKLSELILQFCIDAKPKEITIREIKKYLMNKGIKNINVQTNEENKS